MCCLSCVLTLKWLSIFYIVQASGLGEMEGGLNQKEFRFHRQECAEETILAMVVTYGERSWVRISNSNPQNKEHALLKFWGQ